MSELIDTLAYFHFLRPGWLVLIPVALLLCWRVRRRGTARRASPPGLAPHLAAALTVGDTRQGRLLPVDGVLALLILLSLACAGPTWNRVANPFVAQTAPLAIALQVSQSMDDTDVMPSRLERAKHKILDVIGERTGGRTALIAYAGSSHLVVPLTEDPAVLKPFVEGLTTSVMPAAGNDASAALAMATEALRGETVPGAVLFVLDHLAPADRSAFASHVRNNGVPVVFLVVAGANAKEHPARTLERLPGAAVVRLAPDKSDVQAIERRVASAYRAALAHDERAQWDDRGWLLAWPAALFLALWFRQGWTMRWSVALAVMLTGTLGEQPRAAGSAGSADWADRADRADWFFTPDQQGFMAYEGKRFDAAAGLFQDPLWKGYALYSAGRYDESAQTFARLSSAPAAFAQGMALLKTREYRKSITALETALERDPQHTAAARNLEIARAVLAYLERVREQSGTGEEGGVGADEVVFDKESAGGAATRIDGTTRMKVESAEQWMRTVDTRTEDFLRTRFALEAARRGER